MGTSPAPTGKRPNQSSMLIKLDGEFDLADRERLIKVFAAAATTDVLVLSFASTTSVGSSALQLLCALQTARKRRGAKLILIELSPQIRRLFQAAGLDAPSGARAERDLRALQIDVDDMPAVTLSAPQA